MKLPAYPRYKRSVVEWLGDVPERWEVKRSDAIVSADRSQLSPEAFADQEVFHYSIPVVQEIGTGQVENGESIASAKQVIKKPVVLVSKLNPRKATICLAKKQALLTLSSSEFVALNADDCELAFLEYLTRSELFRQRLDSKVQSVTRSHQRANPADIYKFWNAWPSLQDQRIIALFLDRETGRLNRLVAKKRELIERLKEKRAALISCTVTRGLPPAAARAAGLPENPSLKRSGLDWIGDIPTHWRVLPFTKYVAEKSDYRGKTPDKQPDGVFLVTARNVRMGFIDYESSQEFIAEEDYDEVMRRGLPKKGDVLFTTEAPLGNIALVDREGVALAQRIIRFRMSPARYDSKFTLFAMMSDHFQVQLKSLSTGSTAEGLKASKLPLLRLIAPPVPEQIAIASYLDAETAKLDALVRKIEEAVERLQEYRAALITAAVTGKIDVRKATA